MESERALVPLRSPELVLQAAGSVRWQAEQIQDASLWEGEVGRNGSFGALPAIPPAARWFSGGSRKKADLWISIAI